ncbi:hypothetical protein HanPSC8_Chr17g0752491 [Helianthus annuus]|nr:hypothetical protein HanPSC8_Chr17g0752491 [Helianthus annuus]
MSAVEYRSILKYRLMIPMFPNDETCPVCRKACLDKYGKHALHCRELPGFKYRHDFVRDALMDILRRAGISAKKEAPVNFLTGPSEGRSTLLIRGWKPVWWSLRSFSGALQVIGSKTGAPGCVADQSEVQGTKNGNLVWVRRVNYLPTVEMLPTVIFRSRRRRS